MRLFGIVLICLTFSGCGLRSYFKISDAMEQESVSPNSFKQEIPFRDEGGNIIIDVQIGSEIYNFIFDTGASTILDDDIVKLMNYEKIGTQKHKGTSNEKKILKVIKLDELSIGDVRFSSIVASITDLDPLKKKFCLDFDGIIGANVMNKFVWQIDYSRKIITLTDSRDSLAHPSDARTIDFNATGKGTPMLGLSINGQYIGEGKLDTGSNGGIDLPIKDLVTVDSVNRFIVKQGFSSGLFADRLESSKTTIISNLQIGSDFEIENALVTFNKALPYALIGNKFLRNYLVTIDWNYQEVTLSSFKPHKDRKHHTFGFTPALKEGKIVIGSIYEDSSADREGLKLNDQIVQINAIDFRNSTHESFCELLNNASLKDAAELTITVKRDEEEIKRVLTKQDLVKDVLNFEY